MDALKSLIDPLQHPRLCKNRAEMVLVVDDGKSVHSVLHHQIDGRLQRTSQLDHYIRLMLRFIQHGCDFGVLEQGGTHDVFQFGLGSLLVQRKLLDDP